MKKAPVKPPPQPSAPPPAIVSHAMVIDVTPSPDDERSRGIAVLAQATALQVVDRDSHQLALEIIRSAKQAKRTIEERFTQTKRKADAVKRDILDLEQQALRNPLAAIAILTPKALAYQAAEERRVQEEADRRRRAEEQEAHQLRERQLREQEAAALKAERDSPDLSARERIFVDRYLATGNPTSAAAAAGYKDPSGAGDRLFNTHKIIMAMEATRLAASIREQAAATRQQPLDVVTEKVTANVGKVAGVRGSTSWSAEVVDLEKLWDAILAGKVPREAIVVNQVYLNQQAEMLKTAFDAAFPGCRAIKKQGIAG